jgi:hypothetical protein
VPVTGRHAVDDRHHAVLHLEHRLQDERLADIAPGDAARLAHRSHQPAAVLDRAGVETGEREPVDRTVAPDPSGRIHVGEAGVVLDR